MDKRRTLVIYKCDLAVWKKLEENPRVHRNKINSLDKVPRIEILHIVAKERRKY
jgi:hypothetical protein